MINGILLLDKSQDITSNGALQKVKHLFRARKAGHTGSLDPIATGMLPICFGEATKLSQYLLESDKYYRVTIKLGIVTTTGDAEGEIVRETPVGSISTKTLTAVLAQFVGNISQIPPMYSAIKYKGKPLYELARQGIEIERQPRAVQIHHIELKHFSDNIFCIDVHCSKGTYIRTLAADIGEKLGCGAHVSELRRLAVSPYQQAPMYTLSMLEESLARDGFSGIKQFVLPLESSVLRFPAIKLSTSAAFYIRAGQPVMVPNLPLHGYVRIFSDDEKFLGVGEVLEDRRLAPRRLLNVKK